MPTKDLRARYGQNGGTQGMINRAIRAECPGGGEALDLLTLLLQIGDRVGWADADSKPTVAHVAYMRVCWIVDKMEAAVRATYDMPPAQHTRYQPPD